MSTTENPTARFQVTEVTGGYAVKDTRTGSVWTRTYRNLGSAINRAVRITEAHSPTSFPYTDKAARA
jgi:hypothetical protein